MATKCMTPIPGGRGGHEVAKGPLFDTFCKTGPIGSTGLNGTSVLSTMPASRLSKANRGATGLPVRGGCSMELDVLL